MNTNRRIISDQNGIREYKDERIYELVFMGHSSYVATLGKEVDLVYCHDHYEVRPDAKDRVNWLIESPDRGLVTDDENGYHDEEWPEVQDAEFDADGEYIMGDVVGVINPNERS